MRRAQQPWNLNIHHDTLLLRLVGLSGLATSGDRVLDVGCGDGFLSARLADAGFQVTAIDSDAGVLERARKRWPDHRITWLQGDVLTAPLAESSFQAVLSNATLHHLPDTGSALRRLAQLLRPGGRPGIVGFARNGVLDWPMSLIGSVGIFVAVRMKGKWEHSAPILPPQLTYRQVRRISAEVLPGRHFRRLWLGRFWLTWRRPD